MTALVTVPDYIPAWVIESVDGGGGGDGQGTWWLPLTGELELELEYPVRDVDDVTAWVRRLGVSRAGVLTSDAASRYAQALAVGAGRYVLEVGAAGGALWQVASARADTVVRHVDAPHVQRRDGRAVTVRVGTGWTLHGRGVATVAWQWVQDGTVDPRCVLHPVL